MGYPWKRVVYIAIFLREYWSVGARPGATTDKIKYLEPQLCKGNILKLYVLIQVWARVVARPGATCRDTSKTQPCIKKELIISSDFGGWSGPWSIEKAMNNKPQHRL